MDQTNNGQTDDAHAIAMGLLIDSNLSDTKSPESASALLAMGVDSVGSDEEDDSTEKGSVKADDLTPDIDNQTGGRDIVPATGNETAEFEPSFTPIELSLEAFISAGEKTKHRAGQLYILTPCSDLAHTPVWEGDVKGYFKLSSGDLSKLRPQGIRQLANFLATDIGCGYEDCTVPPPPPDNQPQHNAFAGDLHP